MPGPGGNEPATLPFLIGQLDTVISDESPKQVKDSASLLKYQQALQEA